VKMDDGEIIREYKAGLNKNNMITVLADRNCCTRKEMAQWLVDHGQEVDKRLLREYPKRKKPEPEQEEKFEEILDSVDAGMREPEIIPDIPDVPDQAVKADAGKLRLTLVPTQIIYDIAEIREYGNAKYPDGGPDNWKRVDPQRYRDAAFRHFLKYIEDPKGVDQESGKLHRKHLECNLAFLAALEAENDD